MSILSPFARMTMLFTPIADPLPGDLIAGSQTRGFFGEGRCTKPSSATITLGGEPWCDGTQFPLQLGEETSGESP